MTGDGMRSQIRANVKTNWGFDYLECYRRQDSCITEVKAIDVHMRTLQAHRLDSNAGKKGNRCLKGRNIIMPQATLPVPKPCSQACKKLPETSQCKWKH